MENPTLQIALILMLGYAVVLAYQAWFQPVEFIKQWQRRRNNLKKPLRALPNFLFDLFVIGPSSGFGLWWARIGYLVFILFCIFFINIVLGGPSFGLLD